MFNKIRHLTLGLIVAVAGTACSHAEPEQAYAESPASVGAPADKTPVTSAPALRLVMSRTGNSVRYRIREQLLHHDLPNDAVGETKDVRGALELDSTGKIISQSSEFTAFAATFVSDQQRRDGYVRTRLLEANQYPSIVLVPTEIRGLTLPLPTSGTIPIDMTANLTVHGVTRPTAWKGSAKFQDGKLIGSATTALTFKDIQLEQPRVPVLLSVADTIHLEIDFDLKASGK